MSSNMVVQTNILAVNAHRQVKIVGDNQKRAADRLSSGFRINSAEDDAAGLAISEKMETQIRGMRQAQQNVEDGINLIQTMDGGMETVSDMMIRKRELMIQALNDTTTEEDKAIIQVEIDELMKEIEQISERVNFNNIPLLNVPDDGRARLWIQNGANSAQGMFIDRYDCRPEALYRGAFSPNAHAVFEDGVARLVEITRITTQPWAEATASLAAIDHAATVINSYRAKAGAQQNRLEFSVSALGVTFSNLEESQSRIRDTDMAKEMMNFTKSNVLQQAGISMLAQANQLPQSVLQLLR